MVNIIDNSKATYAIPYTEAELKLLTVKMTGDAYDTELEFGYDTVRIKRTTNIFKRFWGGLCGEIAGWALNQNDKYGDYYLILDEEYTDRQIAELEEVKFGQG